MLALQNVAARNEGLSVLKAVAARRSVLPLQTLPSY